MEEILLNHLIAMFVGYLHFTFLDSIYRQLLDSNRLNNWSKTLVFSKAKYFSSKHLAFIFPLNSYQSDYINVGGDQCGVNIDYEVSTEDGETEDSLEDLPQSPEIKPVVAKAVAAKRGSKSLNNV